MINKPGMVHCIYKKGVDPNDIPHFISLHYLPKYWLRAKGNLSEHNECSRLPSGQLLKRWLSEKNNSSVFWLRFRGAKRLTNVACSVNYN